VDNAIIRLLDHTGKILKQQVFNGEAIDVSHLSPGVYFLEILTDTTRLHKRFVME
jgi:hypothetical protein